MDHLLLLCIVNPPSQDYTLWTSLVSKQLKVNLAVKPRSSSNQFQKEVSFIKHIPTANGYPYTFLNSLVHKFNHIKLIGSEKKFGSQNAFLKSSIQGNQSAVLKRQLHRLC